MALKNMTYSLYSKIALWLVLNLVLLAVLGFGIGWRRIPFTATGCFSNSGASSW